MAICNGRGTLTSRAVLVQGFAGEDFSGLAVSALTLLRHSEANSSTTEEGTATPTQVVRRHPRKPAKATIRALF